MLEMFGADTRSCNVEQGSQDGRDVKALALLDMLVAKHSFMQDNPFGRRFAKTLWNGEVSFRRHNIAKLV